ncbi:double zinc ribbon domain-containing protein [Crateriforma conspicua]|uniref:DNA utilization protein GntX n=1 Tax=Crateriforma conspicua TaxID=2527996 RepID=A0A5C5Y2L6_9PLAN|nr:double zinc ribbon domain-containing protein [Crateriforma conspicua]QDV64569.1 DNA utilization protein GntX [Crateriforma conspicua]TWT69966.1 DNA utilization protein GntX [Crateriforma conspicua]
MTDQRSTISATSTGWVDLVLPPTCVLCSRQTLGGGDFCQDCLTRLAVSRPKMRLGCRWCGVPGGASAAKTGRCTACGGDASGPGKGWRIDRTHALWSYEEAVRGMVVASKYGRHAAIAVAAAGHLASEILRDHRGDMDPLPDVVTYVPSYWTRRLSRGGCSAETLAVTVANKLDRPFVSILRARRPIAKQAWLGDRQRISNVRDAFVVKKSYLPTDRFGRAPSGRIKGGHVMIVDDVMTSGATTNEVARVLKLAGADRVSVGVIARAIRQ